MNYHPIGRVTDDFDTFKRDLLAKYPTCQCRVTVKGRVLDKCHQRSEELDHCLIRKNKKFRKWINALEWNWQPSCHRCNFNHITDREPNRVAWMGHQVEVYGRERIMEDMLTAPEKMQRHNTDWNEVWDWLTKMPPMPLEKENK